MSPAGGTAPIVGPHPAGLNRVESRGFRAGSCHDTACAGCHVIDFTTATTFADSVLYEGHLNHASCASSTADGFGSEFGVLAPRCWTEARRDALGPSERGPGPAESWWNRTECLVEADVDARMEVRLRYLQLASDQAGALAGTTLPREASIAFTLGEILGSGIVVTVDGGDKLQARFLVSASTATSPFQLYKLTVRVENAVRLDGRDAGMSQAEALSRSLISCHLLVGVELGSFLSLIDPPPWACSASQMCRNVGLFPVLAGPWGTAGIVLSAPVTLYDNPRPLVFAPKPPLELRRIAM